MKRDDFSFTLDFADELIIDNFAGGGGTSEGLEQAFGRPVDIAINHDPEALAMHALNHPFTKHLCESVWDVNPVEVTKNQPVGLVWLSPDCKHFSKAKGGTPVSKEIRGLAWVTMRWAALCRPRVIMLENVEEFQTWGPLIVDENGKYKPDPVKKGKTFQSFIRQLRGHGYEVDWRELRACDNGAPTIRKRFFLVARRDGLPICWPEQTHAEPASKAVIAGKLKPFRTAADCIDFSIEAQSIFERKRELVDNTKRRVAKGLWRHVLTSAKPFIVGIGAREFPGPSDPVIAPFIGEHANASNQRNMPADEPLRTVCAQVKGGHFSVVGPTLAPLVMTNTTGHPGAGLDDPLPTITTDGHHALVASSLAPLRGTSEGHMGGHDLKNPLSTISAGGTHHALTMAHMTKFNTGAIGYGLDEPMATITAGGKPKRPSTGITQGLVGANLVTIGYGERKGQDARAQRIEDPLGTVVGTNKHAMVAAHLVDMGHGESSSSGAKRWSHGVRSLEAPLNTVTASGPTSAVAAVHMTHLTHHGERNGRSANDPLATVTSANRGEQALVAACLEQANGGFYEGDGRPADAPMSTITAAGSNQRLINAYMVKPIGLDESISDTRKRKSVSDRVTTIQVDSAILTEEQRTRAKLCADLLHHFLPEHFPNEADMVIVGGWVLIDITLRMLKPRELFRAQAFPDKYIIEEIPDPAILFKNGVQAADPLSVPRIPLSATAQVRMCGNSVSPVQARALVLANFGHEHRIPRRKAA